jgi:hypothetical protein
MDGYLTGLSRLRMETFYKEISLDARNSSKTKDTISTYKLNSLEFRSRKRDYNETSIRIPFY